MPGGSEVKLDAKALHELPDRDFWEQGLLLSRFEVRQALVDDGDSLQAQLKSCMTYKPAAELLARLLGIDPDGQTIEEIRAKVAAHPVPCLHFILISDFMAHKMSVAVADIAQAYLDSETLESCRHPSGDLDRQLMLLHLYLREPGTLRYVMGLSDWHRKGAAPMKLRSQPTRGSGTDMGSFLVAKNIEPALERLRREDKAHPRVWYEMTVSRAVNDHLVFLRRNLTPDYVYVDDGDLARHGHRAEWIILQFLDEGGALRLCSVTNRVPLGAANHIASAFFGEDVEYVTDHRTAQEQAIKDFLASVTDPKDERLPLLELVVSNAPLRGSPKLMITGAAPIIDAVDHFQEAVGELLQDLDHIDSIKVRFQSKQDRRPNRVSVFFPEKAGRRLIQYDDSGMDMNKCREFEIFMLEEFNLAITSRKTKA